MFTFFYTFFLSFLMVFFIFLEFIEQAKIKFDIPSEIIEQAKTKFYILSGIMVRLQSSSGLSGCGSLKEPYPWNQEVVTTQRGFFNSKASQSILITESSELEGTHKDLWVQMSIEWPRQGSNPWPWCYLLTPCFNSYLGNFCSGILTLPFFYSKQHFEDFKDWF